MRIDDLAGPASSPLTREVSRLSQPPDGRISTWELVSSMLIPVIGGLLVMGATIGFAARGFDMGDESYLLTIIRDPSVTYAAGEPFLIAPLLHPVYTVVGEDIFVFRVVGMASLYVATAWLGDELMKATRRGPTQSHSEAWLRVLAAITVAAVASTAFAFTPRVPGYRLLALLGCVVVMLGLVKGRTGHTASAGALLGLGTGLAFVGKLPTALALVIFVPWSAWMMGILTWRLIGRWVASTIIAMGLALLACGMSPSEAYGYLDRGLSLTTTGGGYPSVLRLLGVARQPIMALFESGLPLALVGGAALGLVAVGGRRLRVSAVVVGTAASCLLVFLGVLVARSSADALGASSLGLWVTPMMLSLAALLGVLGGFRLMKRPRPPGAQPADGLVVALLFVPFVYVVGSNQAFSWQLSHAALFWAAGCLFVVGSLVADEPVRVAGLGVVASLGVVMAAIVVYVGVVDGGATSWANSSTKTVVGGGSLLLPPQTSEVMDQLAALREEHGLNSTTPTMDLTGLAPGYQFQLGGKPLGRAYYMSMYPAANDAARMALAHVTCPERAEAWTIYAEPNRFDMSPAFFGGRSRPTAGYDRVASLPNVQWPTTLVPSDVHVERPRAELASALGC